jgi:hypothetical protein
MDVNRRCESGGHPRPHHRDLPVGDVGTEQDAQHVAVKLDPPMFGGLRDIGQAHGTLRIESTSRVSETELYSSRAVSEDADVLSLHGLAITDQPS